MTDFDTLLANGIEGISPDWRSRDYRDLLTHEGVAYSFTLQHGPEPWLDVARVENHGDGGGTLITFLPEQRAWRDAWRDEAVALFPGEAEPEGLMVLALLEREARQKPAAYRVRVVVEGRRGADWEELQDTQVGPFDREADAIAASQRAATATLG